MRRGNLFCSLFTFFLVLFLPFTLALRAQVTFHLDAGKRGARISPLHYGIFFEEINHGGEGGLYAELVRNRSFEEDASQPVYWTSVGSATIVLDRNLPLNPQNPTALLLDISGAQGGVSNEGFWGINIVRGTVYHLTLWMRCQEAAYEGTVQVELRSAAGSVLGKAQLSGITHHWQRFTADITASGTAPSGTLAIIGGTPGKLYLDVVSLFPPTYKGRENGCRIDLAEKLEALQPAFMRFPGGCYVEGNWTADHPQSNHFQWKQTIGPIEQRPGHYNNNWFYPVTDGLGMMEFLQLCEDLGAEPLYVVNMGMGHAWEDPDVEPYIQDALDAIEFCNGDATTTWGKRRIELGHPEPFGLRLLEIGNENYWFGPYSDRYGRFRQAIAARYPDIVFIGDGDGITWNLPHHVDIIDQHYYMTPAWFMGEYHRYDSYARDTYKIYVGEYAVTGACGHYGNMNAALGEAVFMCGMENNSDVVTMTSYAPVFCNENNYQWAPDIIRFNASTSYVTPSYYVQQMMSANRGAYNIKWTEENNTFEAANKVGLSAWGTTVSYDNLLVTTLEGDTLYFNDFSSNSLSGWTNNGGSWSVHDGQLYQDDAGMAGSILTLKKEFGSSYIVECDATKRGGNEGFLLAFNVVDNNDYVWWNVGGWANGGQGVEQCMSGTRGSDAGDVHDFSGIAVGRTYHLKVRVDGTQATCYLDKQQVNSKKLTTKSQKIYLAASVDDDMQTLFVKAVNPYGKAQRAVMKLSNAIVHGGTVTRLSSANGSDENTTSQPKAIVPRTYNLASSAWTDDQVSYSLPAHSLCVFKIDIIPLHSMAEPLPEPLVSYSFDTGQQADDLGLYPFVLVGDGRLDDAPHTADDGDKAFFSASQGYISLLKEMPGDILPQLTADYSVSIDVLPTDINPLNRFCWAYGLVYGTSHYLGLVNSPTNRNWYFEVRDVPDNSAVDAGGGLPLDAWHNVTFVQQAGLGSIYVDGLLVGQTPMEVQPSAFADKVNAGYIARSPFAGDALMSNTYFDNFQIYGRALTEGQVTSLYLRSQKSRGDQVPTAIVATAPKPPKGECRGTSYRPGCYDLSGRRVNGSARGLVIQDGKLRY